MIGGSTRRRGGILGALAKALGLAVLGTFLIGIIASSRRPRPGHAPPPAIAPPPPTPAPVAGADRVPAPAPDIRFGLTERERAEIHNCMWQGGMWASAEAERVLPIDEINEIAEGGDREAVGKYMNDHHDVYLRRRAIAERLVAKKYGLPVETIRAIADEPAGKPEGQQLKGIWKVSESPILFDRREANRVVAEGSMVPLTHEEQVKEERQRLIDRRKSKHSATR